MANDDWRLTIEFGEEEHALGLSRRLQARDLEHGLEESFGDRVIVSRDGPDLFCYAGTRKQLEAAEALVHSLAEDHGWPVTTQKARWHAEAEAWENPDAAVPAGEAGQQLEHEELIARERAEAAAGHPEWEVRVDCPGRKEAVALAERLEAEGLAPVRRWSYLVIGATDEGSARELAERLGPELPEGSSVTVEGTWARAVAERPPNPFAFLGGLGDS
jgi:hypothetical protein